MLAPTHPSSFSQAGGWFPNEYFADDRMTPPKHFADASLIDAEVRAVWRQPSLPPGPDRKLLLLQRPKETLLCASSPVCSSARKTSCSLLSVLYPTRGILYCSTAEEFTYRLACTPHEILLFLCVVFGNRKILPTTPAKDDAFHERR